jgi:hypothetical protein
MRLIDADALANYANNQIVGITANDIMRFPTVDAEPVRHGRWIRAEAKGYPVKRSSIWYCSECGEKIKYNDTLGRYQKTKRTVSQVNPRCRKCGARMDGGAD